MDPNAAMVCTMQLMNLERTKTEYEVLMYEELCRFVQSVAELNRLNIERIIDAQYNTGDDPDNT